MKLNLEMGVCDMSTGQKAIVFVGAFVITFVSICTFFKDDIKFLLTSRVIERKYGEASVNSYFVDDNFSFVDNYEAAEVKSRQDIINSIYYLLNSGIDYSERYCAKDYESCADDMESIGKDTELLSVLNNFVHPYNSFEKIDFSYNNESINITIHHIYSDEDIEEINKVVDEIIDNNITNDMSTRDKIKVIHDYIINNTNYDTSYDPERDDNTYRSNTAYGVLIQGYGICSGYSDAMAIFLNKLNIINYRINNDEDYINSINLDDVEDTVGHIWNLVYLDGEWMHLDLTWDDPISDKNITRDSFFLIPTNTLELLDENNLHKFDNSVFSEAS